MPPTHITVLSPPFFFFGRFSSNSSQRSFLFPPPVESDFSPKKGRNHSMRQPFFRLLGSSHPCMLFFRFCLPEEPKKLTLFFLEFTKNRHLPPFVILPVLRETYPTSSGLLRYPDLGLLPFLPHLSLLSAIFPSPILSISLSTLFSTH